MTRLDLSATELADFEALKAIAAARRRSNRGKLKRRASDAAVLGLAGAIGGQCIAAAADEIDGELIDSLAGLKVVDDLTALDADCNSVSKYGADNHVEHGGGLFSHMRHDGPAYLADPFASRFSNQYRPDLACHDDGKHHAAAAFGEHDAHAVVAAGHGEGHEAAGHGEHEGEGHDGHGDHEVLAANEHDEHAAGEHDNDPHASDAGHAGMQHAETGGHGMAAHASLDGGHHAVMAMAHDSGMNGVTSGGMTGGHDAGMPMADAPADMDGGGAGGDAEMPQEHDKSGGMSLADMDMPPAEDLAAAAMPPMV